MSKHRITRETQTQTYIHNLVSGDRKIAQYRKWGGGEERGITSIYCLSSAASVRNNVWMFCSSVIGLEILLCNCFLREQRDLRLLIERE